MSDSAKSVEPVRVAHVITGLQTGGAEAMLNKLTQSERGAVSAIVIALTEGGKYQRIIEQNGIPVHVVNFKKLWLLPWLLVRLYRLIRQHRTQIIQAWMYHAMFFTSLICLFTRFRRFRPRFLWNIRHSLKDIRFESRQVQWLIKGLSLFTSLPDKVIFNSKNSAVEHQRYWSVASKTQFLPNGFELDVWQPAEVEAANALRERLNIPSGFLLGNVARAHPMKNQTGLINVVKRLQEEFSNVHLVLFGSGTAELQGIDAALQIHGLGECDDIPELLPGLDCFVLCSNWGEGFPNVLGEAMACALPCITTNVGDSAMLLNNADWVAEPFDEEALLQKLRSMIMLTPQERAGLGRSNLHRVTTQFGIKQVAQQYLALYQSFSD